MIKNTETNTINEEFYKQNIIKNDISDSNIKLLNNNNEFVKNNSDTINNDSS